jgi:CRP-like cAMP-binding protein
MLPNYSLFGRFLGMNTLPDILKGCILFKDMSSEDLLTCLNYSNYIIKRYSKGNLLLLEGHKCEEIGILLKGLLKVQTLYPSGKSLTFIQLKPGESFGEAIIFSKTSKCPATISAIEDSEIMYIKKWDLINCASKNHRFMENFLGLLSDRLLILNKKVKMLSLENIRQKIRYFLMKEYKIQKSNIIKVSLSRKEMAEYIGIQRPSLSRELSKMREEEIIEFDREVIIIKDMSALNKL